MLHLIRSELERKPPNLTDADLLKKFASTRDPISFEHLFWRNGPMVRGVCRRVLAKEADAEDALQAVFLLMARKSLRPLLGRLPGTSNSPDKHVSAC